MIDQMLLFFFFFFFFGCFFFFFFFWFFFFFFFFLHFYYCRESLCMQILNRNFLDSINKQPNNFADSHGKEGEYLFMPQNSNTCSTRIKLDYRWLGK